MSGLSPIKLLRGKKVYLRPVLREDIPFAMRWVNDQETLAFLSQYLPSNEKDEEEWLERLSAKRGSDVTLAMVLEEGDKIIGTMGIHEINHKDGIATAGALLGDKDYQEKGLGTEAHMLLLEYAFNTLNLRKVCAAYLAFNGRSGKVQKNCGYKREGIQKKHFFKDGEYVDVILTAVFREDWLPIWKKYKEKHLT